MLRLVFDVDLEESVRREVVEELAEDRFTLGRAIMTMLDMRGRMTLVAADLDEPAP